MFLGENCFLKISRKQLVIVHVVSITRVITYVWNWHCNLEICMRISIHPYENLLSMVTNYYIILKAPVESSSVLGTFFFDYLLWVKHRMLWSGFWTLGKGVIAEIMWSLSILRTRHYTRRAQKVRSVFQILWEINIWLSFYCYCCVGTKRRYSFTIRVESFLSNQLINWIFVIV